MEQLTIIVLINIFIILPGVLFTGYKAEWKNITAYTHYVQALAFYFSISVALTAYWMLDVWFGR